MDVEIIISLKDGKFHLLGPVEDKVMMYGLLEVAREAVYNHHRAKEDAAKSRIVVPDESPFKVGMPGSKM